MKEIFKKEIWLISFFFIIHLIKDDYRSFFVHFITVMLCIRIGDIIMEQIYQKRNKLESINKGYHDIPRVRKIEKT
jgi:hypothetical protein